MEKNVRKSKKKKYVPCVFGSENLDFVSMSMVVKKKIAASHIHNLSAHNKSIYYLMVVADERCIHTSTQFLHGFTEFFERKKKTLKQGKHFWSERDL